MNRKNQNSDRITYMISALEYFISRLHFGIQNNQYKLSMHILDQRSHDQVETCICNLYMTQNYPYFRKIKEIIVFPNEKKIIKIVWIDKKL